MKSNLNKNSAYSIFRIATFINYAVISEDFKIKKNDLEKVYKGFQKRPEKGAEILRKPREVYLNFHNGLGGDCDDYTTLISYIAYKLKIKFRYVFLLKDGKAFHIYPELKINNEWVNYDRWNSKDMKKEHKIIILPAVSGLEILNNKINRTSIVL